MFLGCFNVVCIKENIRVVKMVFQGCFKVFSRVFPGCFEGVSWVFQCGLYQRKYNFKLIFEIKM